MNRIIKIDDLYLTSDGTLSYNQRDAMRVDLNPGSALRLVKLKARTSPPQNLHDDTCAGIGSDIHYEDR